MWTQRATESVAACHNAASNTKLHHTVVVRLSCNHLMHPFPDVPAQTCSHQVVVSHAVGTVAEMRLHRGDVWGHFAPMFHLVDVFAGRQAGGQWLRSSCR